MLIILILLSIYSMNYFSAMLNINWLVNWISFEGIHEVERGEQELQRERELEAENQQESDDSETESGLENRTMGITTPPDSPNAVAQFLREHSLQYEGKFSKIYQYIGVVTGEIYIFWYY